MNGWESAGDLMADGKVVIDTALNNKGFTNGINSMKKQADGLTSSVKKLGAVMAAAFSVKALIDFGKQAVELGSNVAEVQNVVDVAFGELSYKMEEFADSAVQSFGMSQLAAKKTASTYMAMAKGMGISEDAASDMALSLTGLSGDIASFYNISQELADTKLKSVFTGETETLKDLGVVMTQANLQAYALSQGITKNISDMTQAELVGLRYNFVLEQTALANGDFARTSNSWANQTRILSMQWQEFMSVIGQAIIKFLTPLVKILNEIVSGLISMANTLNTFISSIFGGANTQMEQTRETVQDITSGIEQSVENQNALTEATENTAKAQKKMLAGFDEINKLGGASDSSQVGAAGAALLPASAASQKIELEVDTDSAENSIERFLTSFLEIIEPLKNGVKEAFDAVKEPLDKLFGTFKGVWERIAKLGAPLKKWFDGDFTAFLQTFVSTVGGIIGGLLETFNMVFGGIWSTIVEPCFKKFVEEILPMLTEFAGSVTTTIGTLFEEVNKLFLILWKEGIEPALVIIQEIWDGLWTGVIETWEEYGEPIFAGIDEAITGTSETLENIWKTVIKPVWDEICKTVDELWREHIEPLWKKICEFVAELILAAEEIYNECILPIVNWVVEKLGPPVTKVINTITRICGELFGVIFDAVGDLVESLKGVIKFIKGVFTGDWEEAWEGIKQFFKGIWDSFYGLVQYPINKIIDGINYLWDKLYGALRDVVNGVGDAIGFLGDLIGQDWGFEIPEEAPKIPHLAQGAVIPPNREFMAVLGDQKSGYNIEAPEALLRRIVREESGGSGGGDNTLIMEIEGRQFAKLVYKYGSKESRRVGVRLVEV